MGKISIANNKLKKIVVVFLLLFSYLMTAFPLSILYKYIQNGLLRQKDDLLFIHSTYSNAIYIVGLFIFFYVLWLKIDTAQNNFRCYSFKINYVVLAAAVFVLTNIVAVADMFSYNVIRNEGLYVRENIFRKVEFFDWEEIENISVEYNYGTGKQKNEVYFHYYIQLYDERKIDLRNSEEFRDWEKVMLIDDYLNTKCTNIKRNVIGNEIFSKLIAKYNIEYGSYADEVFEKIFNFMDN